MTACVTETILCSWVTQVRWIDTDVVTVGAGATWIDVYTAFKQHGGYWVVTGGLCPSVGCEFD